MLESLFEALCTLWNIAKQLAIEILVIAIITMISYFISKKK